MLARAAWSATSLASSEFPDDVTAAGDDASGVGAATLGGAAVAGLGAVGAPAAGAGEAASGVATGGAGVATRGAEVSTAGAGVGASAVAATLEDGAVARGSGAFVARVAVRGSDGRGFMSAMTSGKDDCPMTRENSVL